MNKISTIIVEDENASLYLLKEELFPFKDIKIIAEYRNGREGLKGINQENPDLVFVDIEMPEMDGFQMLQRVTCQPVIIFCTGHKKYALEAWEYDASDFIIKPIESTRFRRALEKAFDDITNKRQEKRLNQQKIRAGFIELSWSDHTGKKSRFFSSEEITFIQADRDYIKIHVVPELAEELNLMEEFIVIKKTIKDAARDWQPQSIMQVHKSFLINFSKVQKWNKTARTLQLKNVSQPIPISRSFIKQFQNSWQNYSE